MSNCDHKWIVFSTALVPPAIMVECESCGAFGGVLDYKPEEWERAFGAPSEPYAWSDPDRVILKENLPAPTEEQRRRIDELRRMANSGKWDSEE